MGFKKYYCAVVLLMSFTIIEAAWNPLYLSLKNVEALEILKQPDVVALENQVLDVIKNSWCSQEKAQLLMELVIIMRPDVCVEIGAFTGSSTLPLLKGLKYCNQGQVYIIEPWSAAEAIKGLPKNDPNTTWWAGLHMKEVKTQFIKMIKRWALKDFCNILEMNSEQAVNYIPMIDFLHLDGNFSEQGSLLDSTLYVPKVVSGGYILLSNALIMIDGKPTKMKALWPIFDQCDVVCELDQGNTILFRKKS